jgi:hypothetical protein
MKRLLAVMVLPRTKHITTISTFDEIVLVKVTPYGEPLMQKLEDFQKDRARKFHFFPRKRFRVKKEDIVIDNEKIPSYGMKFTRSVINGKEVLLYNGVTV